MTLERWMYDILTEEQKSKFREIIFDRICSQVNELKFSDLSLDTFVEDCGERLDYEALSEKLQVNLERTLEVTVIQSGDLNRVVSEAVQEALENADVSELGKVMVKKLVQSLK